MSYIKVRFKNMPLIKKKRKSFKRIFFHTKIHPKAEKFPMNPNVFYGGCQYTLVCHKILKGQESYTPNASIGALVNEKG